MEWCRSCGGRIRPVHDRCPWCGSPRPRADVEATVADADGDGLRDPEPPGDEEPAFAAPAPLGDEPAFAASLGSPAEVAASATLAAAANTSRVEAAAPLLRRGAAFALDLALLAALDGFLRLVSIVAIAAAGALSGRSPAAPARLAEALSISGGWALFLGYFALLHAGGGQTLGKALLGIRVVRADGRPLDLGRGLARALGYALSAAVFGIGFLLALLPPHRALHDYLAGSAVLSAEADR